MAQLVKNPPAMQETPVQFLGQEDALEKGQAIYSSILGLPWWLGWWRICLQCGRPGFNPWVGKIPWRRERLSTPVFWPGEFQGLYHPWDSRVEHDWATFTFTFIPFSIVAVPMNVPTNSVGEFPSLHISPAFIFCVFFFIISLATNTQHR